MSFEDDSPRALVPALPLRAGLFARFMARIATYVPQQPPPPSPAPELHARIDALSGRVAAHEELTSKRLEESENRTLHLMQQRFGALEREILTSLREEISREVDERTATMRTRIAISAGVALVALVLAVWAVVR